MKNVQELTQRELVSLEGGEIVGRCNPRTKGRNQGLPIIPFGDPRDFGRLLRWSL